MTNWDRRQFSRAAPLALMPSALSLAGWLLPMSPGRAGPLDLLSASDTNRGLKTALERGAGIAVDLLGRPDGFLGNPAVRIGLPGALNDAAKLMRMLGRGKDVDELETSMNRAAESAVPQARDLLVKAVQTMTLTDAKGILTGGETAATDFFAGRTRSPLGERFLPIVSQIVDKVGLVKKWDRVADKASGLGLVSREDGDLRRYVTKKSLDGLYFMIGEEEKKIRRDPVGTGSAVLQRVFGAMR